MSLSYYKVSCLCAKQKSYDGYQFKYSNLAKYETSVDNLDGEEWKKCGVGARRQTYFVSNYGRVKVKYKKNGNERLKKSRQVSNYEHIDMMGEMGT
eukprot:679752_1